MMGAEPWPTAERTGQEVLLINGGQYLSRGALECPVSDSWHTPSELHYILTDLWDRLRSSTRFTRYEGSSSPS
jgi:hypothetical protein